VSKTDTLFPADGHLASGGGRTHNINDGLEKISELGIIWWILGQPC